MVIRKISKEKIITKIDNDYKNLEDDFKDIITCNQNISFSSEHTVILLKSFYDNSKLYQNKNFIDIVNHIIGKKFDESTLEELTKEFKELLKSKPYVYKYRDSIPILNIKQLIAMLYYFNSTKENIKIDSLWTILTKTIGRLNKKSNNLTEGASDGNLAVKPFKVKEKKLKTNNKQIL